MANQQSRSNVSREYLQILMRRIADGEAAALELLYRDTSAKLFGICLRILNDTGEAEEVLQEVYLSVWRKAGQFDSERASPVTWLSMIARNRAIDHLRKVRGTEPCDPASAIFERGDPMPSALSALEEEQERKRLEDCIGELPATYARALRAAFFGGLTYAEIAKQTDSPLGTVKGWMRRSFLTLRKCLER